MSAADLDTEAATLVRDLTPTYAMIPRWVESIRKGPVMGPFVSFFSEAIRVNMNIVRRARYEMATDGYRAIGARRLAGFLTAWSIPATAAMLGKMATGLGDEEEDAMRRLMAPWDQNALLLPLGQDEKGRWRVLNLSYSDPFSFAKKAWISSQRDDFANGDEWAKSFLSESVGPLFQEEMFTAAVVDIMRNADASGKPLWNSQASMVDTFRASGKRLWKAFEPGFIASGDRIYRAATGQQSATGRAYNLTDEINALFTGQRIVTVDPLDAVGYRASEFDRNWAESTRLFTGTE
jgi:hypothetical protein